MPKYFGTRILGRHGGFLKWWYPQNTPKWSFLVGTPMVVGYHHFRKPPYVGVWSWYGWFCLWNAGPLPLHGNALRYSLKISTLTYFTYHASNNTWCNCPPKQHFGSLKKKLLVLTFEDWGGNWVHASILSVPYAVPWSTVRPPDFVYVWPRWRRIFRYDVRFGPSGLSFKVQNGSWFGGNLRSNTLG